MNVCKSIADTRHGYMLHHAWLDPSNIVDIKEVDSYLLRAVELVLRSPHVANYTNPIYMTHICSNMSRRFTLPVEVDDFGDMSIHSSKLMTDWDGTKNRDRIY